MPFGAIQNCHRQAAVSMKRKRRHASDGRNGSRKRQKPSAEGAGSISHPVLSKYYSEVLTLREYLISCLPPTSRRRRRLISSIGKQGAPNAGSNGSQSCSTQDRYQDGIPLLDTVLVGVPSALNKRTISADETVSKDFEAFSQQLNISGSAWPRSQLGSQQVSLNEIIDFCIWLLFNRKYPEAYKPPHVLCYGILRASSTLNRGGLQTAYGIPGLVFASPNEFVIALKSSPWSSVFSLLGKDRDCTILNLLLSCGLFVPLKGDAANYYQISGHALSELQVSKATKKSNHPPDSTKQNASNPESSESTVRALSQIRLVRSRILYARAALNAKGNVAFGLRHIHVLNRYRDASKPSNTAHILKYIFPRQFGLHNVFTSKTDPKETALPFHDYTLREREIARLNISRKVRETNKSASNSVGRIPKRLRGKLFDLTRKLQTRHGRCSYTKLLAYYCPIPISANDLATPRASGVDPKPQNQRADILTLSTSAAQVSAFCRAVIWRVFPFEFFGSDEHNRKIFCHNVNMFVKARRFESFSLDTIMHGMKLQNIAWLCPPRFDQSQKTSLSDHQKRKEIFSELMYYMFDSFLIPLIRTNFHVTESGAYRNRLFYFRHDVWRKLSEPALSNLKLTMFEEVGGDKALTALGYRELGVSQIRLLPKENGMRPITNLRRRLQTKQNGRTILGRSINSTLAPSFSVLNYEKTNQPSRLGASLFSIQDIYEKLRSFRQSLINKAMTGRKLYFVKVDVKGCFDTVPQQKLIQLLEQLLSAHDYRISRRAEIRSNAYRDLKDANPTRKFASDVQVGEDIKLIPKLLQELDKSRTNTVFVHSVVSQKFTKTKIMNLLREHIESNLVKIGKKYYKQKLGIPQGSVVSSLLCSFFYGDLEANHLNFLNNENSVLFRLIDDFLLITSEKAKADKFLKIMNAGVPSYGVSIKSEKSLVNFDAKIGDAKVPKLAEGDKFPYCGILIESKTLDISKDDTIKNANFSDSLTVEYSKRPGYTFRRKMLSLLKVQMHTMLLDMSHNSKFTVLGNVRQSMTEVATKALHYAKCLSGKSPLSFMTLRRTVEDLAAVAFSLLRSKRNQIRNPAYQCPLSKAVTEWVAVQSFTTVFGGRNAKYDEFISWLAERTAELEKRCKYQRRSLDKGTAQVRSANGRKHAHRPAQASLAD